MGLSCPSVLQDPLSQGGMGAMKGGDGLSFCGPWSTPSSDWLRSSARIPSPETVPLHLSVQDLSEPRLEQVVGSGVPGAGESPAAPAFHLPLPFAASRLATSVLLFNHNIKYTMGGVRREKEIWGCVLRGHTALLWPSGLVGNCYALEWERRGGSDGVNK